MIYRKLLPIILLLAISCKYNNNPIYIETNFMFLFEEEIANSNFTLITKIDGMCGNCLNSIAYWNEKLLKNPSDTSYIIIISTLNDEVLKYYLRDMDIKFAYHIDDTGEFDKLAGKDFLNEDKIIINHEGKIIKQYY